MKRLASTILAAMLLTGGAAYAHGNMDHVRGVVTAITDAAITVQVTPAETKTVTINAKTKVMKGETHLALKDVKVGDRVVLEVDKKTTIVAEIRLGAPPAAPVKKTTTPKNKG